jgi:hypothetical protein
MVLLGYHPPLGNLLTSSLGSLELHLYIGTYRNLVNRSTRKMGEHVNARVFFQLNYRDVEGLVLCKGYDRTIIHHTIAVNFASATHLSPFKVVPRAALLACLCRRVLKPVADLAVLDYQLPFVTGIPERLV